MWLWTARFIIRYRLLLIVLTLLSTAFMAYQTTKVRIQYGMPRMLPQGNPTLVVYDNFQERFKEESTVFAIGIEKDLFHDAELFNRWHEMGRNVSQVEGVDTVLSLGSAFNIVKDTVNKRFNIVPLVRGKVSTQEELDSIRLAFEALPFYKDLLYNSSNNYSLMAISMRNDRFNSPKRTEFLNSILDQVRAFETENNLKIRYSGMPYIRESMSALIKSELQLFIMLTLLVTIIILYIFFRSLKPVLISMLVVVLGVIWSLGTLQTLGFEITILTSLIPPLIIVIGIPNCIYLINKFHQELKDHGNKNKALIRVVSKIGKATFMTNATTAVGFLTFVFTDSVILEEFGYVAFISIMFLFFISILTITVSFSYLPPPKESITDHTERTWISRSIDWFISTVTFHRNWVYGITISLCLVAFYGLTLIKTTGNIVDDLPEDHAIVQDLHWFEDNFGGVVPFEVEVNAGKPRQVLKSSVLESINETEKIFDEEPAFSRAISIVGALKFLRQAFYNGNTERYDLITTREKAFFKDYIENAESDKGLLRAYIDSTQQYARISVQVADIGTVEMDHLLNRIRPKIDSIFNPKRAKQDSLFTEIGALKEVKTKDSIAQYILSRNGGARKNLERELTNGDTTASVDLTGINFGSDTAKLAMLQKAVEDEYIEVNLTGPSVTFLEGTNYLVNNLFQSLAFAIIIVALLMAGAFNSLRMVVVSVITNLIPLLFTAAVMGYFGIAIKPSTLLVFSIAFGISVDDTIHYLAKYRQELKITGEDIGKSVRLALKETGVSMVYTSVILFFGFSVFDLSQFGGTQALGILVSLTLFVAMFCNLILLPSFLLSFERRMITKSFREPYFNVLDEDEDIELDNLDFGDKAKEQ